MKISLVFSLALVLITKGSAQSILTDPESQTVAPNETFSFTCIGTGDLHWWINGNKVLSSAVENYFRTTLCFSRFIEVNLGNNMVNITVTGVASLAPGKTNNETRIFCRASLNHNLTSSETVDLIIADSPLPPPTPQLMALNATALQLSWFPPYTWLPKYPVLNYDVIIQSTIGTVERYTIDANQSHQLQFFIYTQENIAESCSEIAFSVTATSLVGESGNSDAVIGGFPIAPGPFPSDVNVNISVGQNNSIVVDLSFEIVAVCSYQQASYKAIFTNTGDGSALEVGPLNSQDMHVAQNITTIMVNKNIITIMVIGLVEQEQSYSCVIVLETLTGSVYSDAVTFTTTFTSTSGNTMIIAVVSITGGCVLTLFIAALLVFICYHYKWKYKIRNVARQNGASHMVTNPIYEGGEEGPVYETIVGDTNVGCLAEARYQDIADVRCECENKEMNSAMKPWSDITEDESYVSMKTAPHAC